MSGRRAEATGRISTSKPAASRCLGTIRDDREATGLHDVTLEEGFRISGREIILKAFFVILKDDAIRLKDPALLLKDPTVVL